VKTKSNLDRIDVAFEIKSLHDDDEDDKFFIFEGLASTFGNLDLVDDIVMPGAFKESIEKQLPIILWQHNSHEPIGMPIEIRETIEGLFIKARLPKEDTFVSGRVIPQLKIGSIKTMSIGFIVVKQEFDLEDPRIRKLIEIDLKEISLVTFPANPKAVITGIKSLVEILNKTEMSDKDKSFLLKNLQENDEDEKLITVEDVKNVTSRREFEKFLREAGLSKSAAEIAASNKFNESLQGEPVDDDVELKNALAAISSNFDNTIAANEISKISQRVTSYEHRIKRT
jgi:hypothetical protein